MVERQQRDAMIDVVRRKDRSQKIREEVEYILASIVSEPTGR